MSLFDQKRLKPTNRDNIKGDDALTRGFAESLKFYTLFYNKEYKSWILSEMTGSDHDVSGGLTPLLGPLWQASNLPWADPRAAALASLPPVGRGFHFGRLGFYKRSAQGQGQGTVSSAPP